MTPNLQSPESQSLSFWLKAVRALCVSNPEANMAAPEPLGSIGLVQFSAAQNLELDEARLLRLAKTMLRLSKGSGVAGEWSWNAALLPPMTSSPLAPGFEGFFLKDPGA